MSKMLLICPRDRGGARITEEQVRATFGRITPDNLNPRPVRIERYGGVLIGIFNPTDACHVTERGAYAGLLFSPEDGWSEVRSELPDGSFAMFRYDEDRIEIASDTCALTTLWWAYNSEFFIASSSQRVLAYFLGSFEPNPEVFPWVLSTGYLGPEGSWDRRIARLRPSESVVLDRNSWTTTSSRQPIVFEMKQRSKREHITALGDCLRSHFDRLSIDPSEWILPLSGGYDSRYLFLQFKDRGDLSCVTWGLEKSIDEPLNDAYISRELAKRYGVKHEYYVTEQRLESRKQVEEVFERFLIASEGRIDHISSFTDGMRLWKRFSEMDRNGVIRGTEAFGWAPVNTVFDVIRQSGMRTFRDYPNLNSIVDHVRDIWGEQALPESFCQRRGETLETWRDRLFLEHVCPLMFAGIADNMLTYVDVIHPYMSRDVIECVCSLPDHLRSGKSAFKKVVESITPPLPFAVHAAIADLKDPLHGAEAVNLIREEIDTSHAKSLLSPELVRFMLDHLSTRDRVAPKTRKLKGKLQALLPVGIRNMLRNTVAKARLDPNVLAFRASVISRMNRLLSADAMAGKSAGGP